VSKSLDSKILGGNGGVGVFILVVAEAALKFAAATVIIYVVL